MPTHETTQEIVQKILGDDFSSVENALRLFPTLNYPRGHKENMATVPYSASFLKQRKGSLVIVPGFNRLSGDIFSLRTLDGMFFTEKSKPHISHHNRHFNALTFPEHQLWSGTENFFSSNT